MGVTVSSVKIMRAVYDISLKSMNNKLS